MERAIENRKAFLLSCRTEDEVFSKCLSFYWASAIANSVFKRIIGGGTMGTIVSAVVCMPLFFYFVIRSLFAIFRKRERCITLLVPALVFLLAFAVSYLRGIPLDPMPTLIMWGMLGLFQATVIISISDYNVLYEEFRRMIPIYLVLALPSALASKAADEYMMHFSFLLVLPICICFYAFFEEKRRVYCIPFMVFFVLVFLFGSRGPLGCILAFMLLHVLLKSRKISIKIVLLLFIAIGLLFYTQILTFVATFLDNHGLSSRTIWILINDPTHTSGRDVLYAQAQKMIDMKPLLGWGVAGERLTMEVYPHSIVYEFLVDFGKPLGYFLLVGILCLFVFGFFRYRQRAGFFYTAFIASNISLLWSGSYLSTPTFWISIYMALFAIASEMNERLKKTVNIRPDVGMQSQG